MPIARPRDAGTTKEQGDRLDNSQLLLILSINCHLISIFCRYLEDWLTFGTRIHFTSFEKCHHELSTAARISRESL